MNLGIVLSGMFGALLAVCGITFVDQLGKTAALLGFYVLSMAAVEIKHFLGKP